jgi:hypothetical protein
MNYGGSRSACGPGAGTSRPRSSGVSLYEALDGLQYVRDQVLFRLLAYRRGGRPSGARRVEATLGDREGVFANTISLAHDAAAVLSALRAEIDLSLDLSSPLVRGSRRNGDDETRTVVRRALEAGLDWIPAPARRHPDKSG